MRNGRLVQAFVAAAMGALLAPTLKASTPPDSRVVTLLIADVNRSVLATAQISLPATDAARLVDETESSLKRALNGSGRCSVNEEKQSVSFEILLDGQRQFTHDVSIRSTLIASGALQPMLRLALPLAARLMAEKAATITRLAGFQDSLVSNCDFKLLQCLDAGHDQRNCCLDYCQCNGGGIWCVFFC